MEGWRADTLTLVLVNPKDLISLYRARRKGKQIIERYKVIFKNGEKHRLQLMVNNFKWHFFLHIFILSIEDSEDLLSQLSLLCFLSRT